MLVHHPRFAENPLFLKSVVFTSQGSESSETQEDVYVASVETDRGVKEQLRLYDTKGLHDGQDLPKHYYSVADGFVLVYSVDSSESFRKVDTLKKEIDKSRDKKEVWLVQTTSFSPPCSEFMLANISTLENFILKCIKYQFSSISSAVHSSTTFSTSWRGQIQFRET